MDYEKLQHSIGQHTVPKCYLKNFSSDGYNIFTKKKINHINDEFLDKELKKPESLKQATVVKDFYTTQLGKEPMVVETMFYANLIENHYPEIYKSLINPEIQAITMGERDKILTFFLSLHLRTPKQFKTFFESIPNEYKDEIELIKEDYKAAHLLKVLPELRRQHEFKRIRVIKITGNQEFFTSDNPVLIIDSIGNIRSNEYKEWFNRKNNIAVPLDTKHCLVFINSINGVDLYEKGYVNFIDRIEKDGAAIQDINMKTLWNADKYYFGSEQFITTFFSVFKLKIKEKEN